MEKTMDSVVRDVTKVPLADLRQEAARRISREKVRTDTPIVTAFQSCI